MVLDPLSAVSLAATIVQFVDFSSKIVSKGYHLYGSVDGALPENQHLSYVITDLKGLNTRLQESQNLAYWTKDEKALQAIAYQCSVMADELLFRLNCLKVPEGTRYRKWKSFRQALKSVWNKEDLDKLAATLSEYRSQLEMHILVSLRESNDMLAIQQTKQFDRLDTHQKEIIRLLQGKGSPFTDTLKTQNVLIAKFYRNHQELISSEHERTRAEIRRVFNQGVVSESTSKPIQSTSENAQEEKRVRLLVERALLQRLKFSSMADRYHGIEDVHEKTFDWVLEPPDAASQPWNDFSKWLAHGDHIYWINGKAGSGKSTLMRYIYEHKRTAHLLENWSSSSGGLISAGFFFWKSGVPDQASQSGLLRSLLYTLLEQKRNALPIIFPDEWDSLERRARVTLTNYLAQEDEQAWSVRQLRTALETFFCLDLDSRVCIFIDGLDEYSGDPSETVLLFKKIASKNVKICLSSRPWVEFIEAFKESPGLKLQDLTYNDIRTYVEGKFDANDDMTNMSNRAPSDARHFIEEIVKKANGVFLWVKLVVKSLLDGIMNGDRIIELQQRLKEIPSDLESLYAHMLLTINPRYFVEGCEIFQMVQALQNLKALPAFSQGSLPSFCALTLSFALEEDESATVNYPASILLPAEIARRVGRVDKRLKVCCAGLLEFQSETRRSTENKDLVFWEHGNSVIQYIHRTASDFLLGQQIWNKLLEATRPTNFNPHTSLLKSYILRLKTGSMVRDWGGNQWNVGGILTVMFWPHMTLAYHAGAGRNPPSVRLLDELCKTISDMRSKVQDIIPPVLAETWPTDFLILAVRFPLFDLLRHKFALPNLIPRSPLGHSYLHYALREGDRAQPITISESIIAFLLPYSSPDDIQEGWITALKCVADRRGDYMKLPHGDEAQMWLTILRLFLEYGADHRAKIKIMMPAWEPSEENYKTYSAVEVITLLKEEHPQEVSELLSLLKRRRRSSLRLSGLFTSQKKKALSALPLDIKQYPARTWWVEDSRRDIYDS